MRICFCAERKRQVLCAKAGCGGTSEASPVLQHQDWREACHFPISGSADKAFCLSAFGRFTVSRGYVRDMTVASFVEYHFAQPIQQ